MMEFLDANRELLLKNMVPEDGLLNNLLCMKLISERTIRDIKGCDDITDRNVKILNSLSFRTEQQWGKFCECLLRSGHTYLAETIIIRAPQDRCATVISILKTSPRMLKVYQSLSPNEKQEIGQTLDNQILGDITKLLWAKMAEEKIRTIESNLNQAQEVWSLNERIKDREEGVHNLEKALSKAQEEIVMKNEKISALQNEFSVSKTQWQKEFQLLLKHNTANESSLKRYEERWRESEKILGDMIIKMQKIIPRTSRVFREKSITLVHKVYDLLHAVLEAYESFPADSRQSFGSKDRRQAYGWQQEISDVAEIKARHKETNESLRRKDNTYCFLNKLDKDIQTNFHTGVTIGIQTKEFGIEESARKDKLTQTSVSVQSKASQTIDRTRIPDKGNSSMTLVYDKQEKLMTGSQITSYKEDRLSPHCSSESSIHLSHHQHPIIQMVSNPNQSKTKHIDKDVFNEGTDDAQSDGNFKLNYDHSQWMVDGPQTWQTEARSNGNVNNADFQIDLNKKERIIHHNNEIRTSVSLPSIGGRSLRIVPLVEQPLKYIYKQSNSQHAIAYADTMPPQKTSDALRAFTSDTLKSNRRTTGLLPLPLMESFPQLSFRPQDRQVSIPSKKIFPDDYSRIELHSKSPLSISVQKK